VRPRSANRHTRRGHHSSGIAGASGTRALDRALRGARVRIVIGRRSADVRGRLRSTDEHEWRWVFQSFIIASIVE
jgi:hypothetical protein